MSAAASATAADARGRGADEHEREGGNRITYLFGWDWSARGGKLFQGMRQYPEGSTERASFVTGYMDQDAEASSS